MENNPAGGMPPEQPANDWSKLPDQPGVYVLTRIFAALDGNKNVNIEDFYGTKLKAAGADYKAAAAALREQESPENTEKYQAALSALEEAINVTPVLVPFRYSDDPEDPKDQELHLTRAAAARINVDSILFRCMQMSMLEMDRLGWTVGEDGSLGLDPDWWDISRFRGSSGFSYSTGGLHGTLNPMLLSGSGRTFLGVYTDFLCLKKFFRGRPLPRIAVFAVGDYLKMLKDMPDLGGILFNPDTPYRLFLSRALLGFR